jgi:putative peptide maturation dehydrogenase
VWPVSKNGDRLAFREARAEPRAQRRRREERAMSRVRRTKYLFFHFHDVAYPEIGSLLRGTLEVDREETVLAISVLASEELPIPVAEVERLFAVPSDRWVDAREIFESGLFEPDDVERFIRAGVLLSDADDEATLELRRRDERIGSMSWNVYGALYYSITRWRNVDTDIPVAEDELDLESGYKRFVETHGPAPTHFYRSSPTTSQVSLPLEKRNGELYRLLRQRRSTRSFDPDARLSAEELGTILYYTYGCHGLARYADGDVVLVHKTSPSAGSLHPVEVYPLLLRPQGIHPGLYHYVTEDHSLELVHQLSLAEAEDWASEFTAGQDYFRSALALFVLVARFDRTYWKYTNDDRMVATVLMDAAHLSQTFYLVCADLGLGACITAALNVENVEEKIGLDVFREGALAASACGRPTALDPRLHPPFEDYVPEVANH